MTIPLRQFLSVTKSFLTVLPIQKYTKNMEELSRNWQVVRIKRISFLLLKKPYLANISIKEIDAIACTRGPGLMGSLVVGVSFAKSLALSLNVPIIEVNHMKAHILAHFIHDENKEMPKFPFLCLTVSGGHTPTC